MDHLNSRQVLERAGLHIKALCREMDNNAGAARNQLENYLRLWSECRAEGEKRYVWLDERDGLPDAAECDALIVSAGEWDEAALLPYRAAGKRVYVMGSSLDAPAASAYRHLPGWDSATALFDGAGRMKGQIVRSGLDTLAKNRTAYVLLAGGAGTRYVDSVADLARAMAENKLSDEQKTAVSCFESIGMDAGECMKEGKLFAPLSAVMKKSALAINLESIAEVLAMTHADMPVIVFVSSATKADVIHLLDQNDDFGIANLAVAEQDEVPFVCEDDYSLLRAPGGDCASGANGGGGIIYSLGHARPVNKRGESVHDGSILDWMDALGVRHVVFSQTDDAKSRDIYLGLSGAAGPEPGGVMVAAGSHYPTAMTGETPAQPAFRLGSIWGNDAGSVRCIEFGELDKAQKELLTVADRPDGRAIANTGIYLVDRDFVGRVIASGLLGIHFQRHKRETDENGQTRQVTKFEYFLPDLLEIASGMGARCRIALLRDTTRLPSPLTDLTVDALPAKDICKLALAQKAKLYCDTELARAAGLAVEEGAVVEIGPFADICAGKNVIVKRGARLYIGGTARRRARVTFGDGVRIEAGADLRLTGPASFSEGAIIKGHIEI